MKNLSTYNIFRKMVMQNPNINKLSPEDVRAVQKVLLSMMDDVHSFCLENDLIYAISAGGTLGAVRHNGFIPWDDDMDICIPRSDYETFRDSFAEKFSDKYFVQEVHVSKGYDLNFMKIRLKNSRFLEPLDSEPEKAGIFIDVFPVENLYQNPIGREIQTILSDGMLFICSCVRIRKKRKRLIEMAGECREAIDAIRLKSLIALPFSILPLRTWLLLTEKVLTMCHNEKSKRVVVPTGGLHCRGEQYARDTLFPGVPVRFEDRIFNIHAGFEGYLTRRYGDYMTPPPEDERERHAVLEFSLPNTEK